MPGDKKKARYIQKYDIIEGEGIKKDDSLQVKALYCFHKVSLYTYYNFLKKNNDRDTY